MTQNIYNALTRADELLNGISVKGNDVYLLVEARQMLKIVFDEINVPKEKQDEGSDDS